MGRSGAMLTVRLSMGVLLPGGSVVEGRCLGVAFVALSPGILPCPCVLCVVCVRVVWIVRRSHHRIKLGGGRGRCVGEMEMEKEGEHVWGWHHTMRVACVCGVLGVAVHQ